MGTAKSTPAGDGNPVAGEGQGALDLPAPQPAPETVTELAAGEDFRNAPIVDAIAAEVADAQAEVTKMREDAAKVDAIAAGDEKADPDPPVYDERGNVRPRGTEGAKPMTFAQRKRIAERLAKATPADDRTTATAEPPTANPEQKGQTR